MSKKLFLVLMIVVLGLLSACAGSEVKEPVRVEITLTDFGMESSLTEFEAGQPYEFVIVNEGSLNHEVMISPPMDSGEHMDMGHDEHGESSLFEVKEDELPPGATVTREFTFPKSAADETLELACHVEGHYEQGMRTPIVVAE